MKTVQYTSIGIIHSPFKERKGTPRQAAGSQHISGTIEIFEPYQEGITDLKSFSHIVAIFHMYLIDTIQLTVQPSWSKACHGVFVCCSPHRPNPIGLSIVRLEHIENTILSISGLDTIDQSPVLDIKPYVPALYPQSQITIGWLAGEVPDMVLSKTGDR
jgi:tRNA-Thr(GGU) m(6)t(6)A37 methyltransferase TsaA